MEGRRVIFAAGVPSSQAVDVSSIRRAYSLEKESQRPASCPHFSLHSHLDHTPQVAINKHRNTTLFFFFLGGGMVRS